MTPPLKDITEFPHASAISNVHEEDHLRAHHLAFVKACVAFLDLNERMPNFDIINFRGAHSTTGVVMEIWEEE
jgi:hypothetical protein